MAWPHPFNTTPPLTVEHALKLGPGLLEAAGIVRVNDENDALGIFVVVTPERANLVLAADVPHGKGDVLVGDGLNVEACRGGRVSER